MKLKKFAAGFTAAVLFSTLTNLFANTNQEIVTFAASDVVVDVSTEYQTITGFGGINHPEWTMDKGGDLTAAQRQTIFGNGKDELGFTVLRVFVNPDKNQWKNALPTAQYASKLGVTVFASPWEPPANLAESGGSNGKLHLPKKNYAAYAQHLNDFGQYMKDNGVDLYSISVQNEPDYASEWTYWSTDETTDFLANYADKITSTRVMSPESFQYAPENASWVPDGGKKFYTKILNNPKAFANCDLFGTHFYGTQRAWMDFPALENCGKPIWMTEVYVPDSKIDANKWPDSIDLAENIHNGLVVGNMSAYVCWYLRRSYGPITEDGKISKRGYLMAQYSKFVRPGYKRVEVTEQPADKVYVSAYKGDGNKIVVVAVNKSDNGYAQHFTIGKNITDVDRYRTSGNENLALTENLENENGAFYAQLPAKSVSTFVITTDDAQIIEPTTPTNPVEPDENGYYFHDTFEDSVCDWSARGGNKVGMSGRFPYKDTNALVISERTAVWNGAQKELSLTTFKPGNKYSFSTVATFLDSDSPTEKFSFTLQYVNKDGDTKYVNIDSKTSVKGNYVQLANKSFTIPDDAASDMMLVVESANSTSNFYIDEVIAAKEGIEISGPAEIKFTLGDINSDDVINVFDFMLAKRGLIKGFSNNNQNLLADVDQNGSFETNDIVLIQQYIIKKITKFPNM